MIKSNPKKSILMVLKLIPPTVGNLRSSSGRIAKTAEPTITPGIFPMPPSITASIIFADIVKSNEPGEILAILTAKKLPATPPKAAPIAYAQSL
jgi:hypothetical protein